MSSTMEVEPVDRIDVIAHAFSQISFELEVSMDLPEEMVHSNLYKNTLCVAVTRCENHIH